MSGDEVVPRVAPIKGGGRCDICQMRAFRKRRTGGYRHAGCEPDDKGLSAPERTARTQARMWTNSLPEREPDDDAPIADVVDLAHRSNGHGP